MKTFLRITVGILSGLFLLIMVGYRTWFHNPHSDRLHLDPASVFSVEDSSEGLLIRNATLIDVAAGEAVPSANLIIRDGIIAEISVGEEPEVEIGMRVYDARDKFVMPGLVDTHVHLAMHPHLINGDNGPRDSLASRAALEQFVRYGVTTVLALGGGEANDEQAAELKRLERSNAIVAPWLFSTGNVVTAPGSHPITTIMRLPADADSARLHRAGVTAIADGENPSAIVATKKRLGLDGVKIVLESGPPPWHPNPQMSVETASRIVDHASRQGLPVFAHAESHAEFVQAVSLGVHGALHSVMDTDIHDASLIERMKVEGIWYVPSLSVLYGFQFLDAPQRLDDEFLQRGVSKRTLRGLEHPLFRFGFRSLLRGHDVSEWLETSMRNLVRLHQQGVDIALGTDASTPFNFPGYGAHVEMELMTRAGLTNADALRIATLNGARFLGIDDQVGTLTPGKIANLLVLNGNPLTDIRKTRTIERVILKGHLIDPHGSAALAGDP